MFQFSNPIKRFVDTTSGKPTFKVTTTQNKFQLNASAMNLMGITKGMKVNIVRNVEAENINEAFALCVVDGDDVKGATITVPANTNRGEFSFSGLYGMMIAQDTQIEYSPTQLTEMGIVDHMVYTDKDGNENDRYIAKEAVIADIAEAVEVEINGSVYVIYPLVNFRNVARKVVAEGEVSDEFTDLDDDDDESATV